MRKEWEKVPWVKRIIMILASIGFCAASISAVLVVIFCSFMILVILICALSVKPVSAATLSWTAPTQYTDNTLIAPAEIQFLPYWTYDKNISDESLNLIPMVDNTQTSVTLDPAELGMNEDSPTYYTVKAVVNSISSAKSNAVKWYVGSSGWRGPYDVRLMEQPWSTGRGNFAVSWSAPRDNTVNPAYYKLFGRANSFGNVQGGMLLYQGTNRSACATIGGNIDSGVAVQVVAYDSNGNVLSWSEKAFFLPGTVSSEDITTARVDFGQAYSYLNAWFGRYLSEFGQSPRPDIPQCGTGTEFIVPVITLEQKADMSGDGRIGPEDILDASTRLGNRTVR